MSTKSFAKNMHVTKKRIILVIAAIVILALASYAALLAYRAMRENQNVRTGNENTSASTSFVAGMMVPTGYHACGRNELGVRFAVPAEARCSTIFYRYQSILPMSKIGHEPLVGIHVTLPVGTDASARTDGFSIFFYDGSDGFNGRVHPGDLLGTVQVDPPPEGNGAWDVTVERWRVYASGYDLKAVLTRQLNLQDEQKSTLRLVEASGWLSNDIAVYAFASMNGDHRYSEEHQHVRAVMEQVLKSIETR